MRSGEWNQVRIWSDVNLGNLRKKDLFVTNARMEILNIGTNYTYQVNWENSNTGSYVMQLEKLNGMKLND